MDDDVETDREEEGTTATDPVREPKSAKAWLAMIADAERIFGTYHSKADSIDKLYANLEALSRDSRDREFQLFWANVAVLGPSIYSRPPVPVVVPQFKDRKALSRAAAELLERTLVVGFRMEKIDDVMRLIRDDLVIQARGAPWLRYEAEKKGGYLCERVCIDHADRRDFLHDPARSWKEVDWVAKRSWLTKKEMRKRFKATSGDVYKTASYDVRRDDADADDGKVKAGVWELWSKSLNRVVWVAEGCEQVLEDGKPHLKLEGFFPCPKPAYATVQRRTLIPVPDFVFYKDQLEEINELTARIAALADALKVRGFYPAGAGDIGDAIEAAVKSTTDNQILIPIANWQLVGNAGVKDMIVWLPLEMVATTITQLVTLRKELMDDVYQITGLSDIMRGQTEASETLGAQKLKSQYGSVRIRDRQDEMIRVARDIAGIAGEIMAENFQAKTLLEMSQLEIATDNEIAGQTQPIEQQIRQILVQVERSKTDPQLQAQAKQDPEAAQQALAQARQQVDGLRAQLAKLQETPTIEKVMALLREQRLRPFILDIETDSTIAPDEDAQKQRATEFVAAIGQFMEKTLPLVAAQPEAAPLAGETLKFVAGQFRAGRQLEGVIDEFADRMAALAGRPKPPDPKIAEAAAAQQEKALKAKTDAETAAADNAERTAAAQKTIAEANAKTIASQTEAADAESARRIREQEATDQAEARRIEREGKIQLTDMQIRHMEAKRADDMAKHAQDMNKGALEVTLLEKRIEQTVVSTDNSIAAANAAAKSQPKEPAYG